MKKKMHEQVCLLKGNNKLKKGGYMRNQKIVLLSIFIFTNLNFFAGERPETLTAQLRDDARTNSPLARSLVDISRRDETSTTEDTATGLGRVTDSSSLYKKDEIDETKTTLKITGGITLGALATAGILHYTQKNRTLTRGSSLLSAGDIFGAGSAAQGAGAVVKGVALAIAAGGVIYAIRKFYGLIDLRFEAQEEKHRTERELALRQNNDAWTQRLTQALKQQEQKVQEIISLPIQQLSAQIQENEAQNERILAPLIRGVNNLNSLVKSEQEKTAKRFEPLLNWAQHVTERLEQSKIFSETKDSSPTSLQQDLSRAGALAQESASLRDMVAKEIQQAQAAMAAAQNVQPAIVPVGAVPPIVVDPPKVVTDKACCGCSIC
jgi:hypothetical protein